MKPLRVGLVALLFSCPFAVASAQPADDESDPAPGDLAPADDGTISHESDEVIGPDGPEPTDAEPTEVHADGGVKTAGYDKGFFLRSDDEKFSLKISGRVQPYFTLTRTVIGDVHEVKGAFEIRRARLTLEGNLHGKNLLYKFQTDFGKGAPSLKDFYFDTRLSGDTWLRVGQWKRPFSRQQINSSGRLEFTSRSITDKAFGAERDIGIAIRNDYEKSTPIEWTVGVWNGTGVEPELNAELDPMTGEVTGGFTNIPKEFKPAFIGRVGINSEGIKGYSEADLEGGPLRWGAAASFWAEANFDEDDESNDKVEIDYVVKVNGFSSTGGFYAMTAQTDKQPLSSQELARVGMHLQAGFMATPTIQAVARYALVNERVAKFSTHEVTIGAGYYGWGHDAKLQGNLRFIKAGEDELGNNILFELESNIGF